MKWTKSGRAELAVPAQHQAEMGDLLQECTRRMARSSSWNPLLRAYATHPRPTLPQSPALLDRPYSLATAWTSETGQRGRVPGRCTCFTRSRRQADDAANPASVLEDACGRLPPESVGAAGAGNPVRTRWRMRWHLQHPAVHTETARLLPRRPVTKLAATSSQSPAKL
jgi:hypothetical protein